MQPFIGKDFLLKSETAKTLFHQYAADMPIFDYHNHLEAEEIYNKKQYENLTQLWLTGDHYKWRVMRMMGIDEKYITGDAADYDKFMKWAYTVRRLPGSPLYHWVHLELQRYFDISLPLNENTAEEIWNLTVERLKAGDINARSLLESQKVKALCTTNDPYEDLQWHKKLREDSSNTIKVLPCFRPDKLLHVEQPIWKGSIAKMEERYKVKIDTWESFCNALSLSLDFFAEEGCLMSDHGFIHFNLKRGENAAEIFTKALNDTQLSKDEIAIFKGELMYFLGKAYHKRSFAMQMHLGALRNTNSGMFKKIGPDTGFDSVGAATSPKTLASYLNRLARKDNLPPTIFYCLNPNDSLMMATMAPNFASADMPAKIQVGTPWWHSDTLRGIQNQLTDIMETGQLFGSTGMLTDSRSFTSFCRHEYYRRILCNMLGKLVEEGGYENDIAFLGEIVQNICYNNAVRYFHLNTENA